MLLPCKKRRKKKGVVPWMQQTNCRWRQEIWVKLDIRRLFKRVSIFHRTVVSKWSMQPQKIILWMQHVWAIIRTLFPLYLIDCFGCWKMCFVEQNVSGATQITIQIRRLHPGVLSPYHFITDSVLFLTQQIFVSLKLIHLRLLLTSFQVRVRVATVCRCCVSAWWWRRW